MGIFYRFGFLVVTLFHISAASVKLPMADIHPTIQIKLFVDAIAR
jgi:hypothetical protein